MIDETVREIEEMQTHSSSIVAVKAAEALAELADREFPTVEAYLRALEQNSHALQRANPSHASLHTTQEAIIDRVRSADPADVDEATKLTQDAIDDVVADVTAAKERAASRAVDVIAEDDTLLLHDYSSTVISTLEKAIDAGETFDLYLTESRPRYLGRKTARELSEHPGLDVTLIVDSASGYYLSECDRVLLGMTCIVEDRLYNRVGTYPLASTAADCDVPVTIVGSGAKIVDGGFSFENDFRPASEVMREPADGFTIENPAYDATPVRLLDTVVTDDGVVDPLAED